jgi:hypothetical protein
MVEERNVAESQFDEGRPSFRWDDPLRFERADGKRASIAPFSARSARYATISEMRYRTGFSSEERGSHEFLPRATAAR